MKYSTNNSIYIAVFLLVIGLVFLSRAHLMDTGSGYAAMGYDRGGKYILVVAGQPTVLNELKVGGETVAENLWVPKSGAKVRYVWESGKTYRVSAELGTGKFKQRVVAPRVEPKAVISSAARTPDSGWVLRLHSLGHDRLLAYPLEDVPEFVSILEYPTVATSGKEFDTFTSALTGYLSKAQVRVRHITDPAEGLAPGTVLVIASGTLPADETILKRIQMGYNCTVLYLGMPPDGVVVDSRGNVDTSPGIFPATGGPAAPVGTDSMRMKESAYTCLAARDGEVQEVVERSDGHQAVYRTGCMTVLTNTIGSGWDSPQDAAWDAFIGIMTGGRFHGPVAEYRPGGDVLNSLVQVPAGAEGIMVLVYDKGGENLVQILREDLKRKVANGGSNSTLSLVFLGEVLPGEREALVKFDSPVNGTGKIIATNLDTTESLVTDLGEVQQGRNAFRRHISLPPGRVVVAVEVGDWLSGGQYITVPQVSASARTVGGGGRKRKDTGYLVEISLDGQPYHGVIEVDTPGKGRGRLEIDGTILVRDQEFSLYLEGYPIPVSWESPDTGAGVPLELVAVAMAFGTLGIAVTRRKREKTVTIVFKVVERKEGALVTASRVVAAFEQYNKHMGFEKFPLSTEEVKHALGMYVSKGVTPTRTVVEDLMAKMAHLREDLRVEEHYGYYVPTKWARETGQSAEHLAMIRAVYDYALDRGYYAEPITRAHGDYHDVLPDMVLTDRQKVVYVEVLSSKRRKNLQRDLGKYLRRKKALRAVDETRGFGYVTEIWVVLPGEDYMTYRQALERDEWEDSALFRAMEKEGEIRVLNIEEVSQEPLRGRPWLQPREESRGYGGIPDPKSPSL